MKATWISIGVQAGLLAITAFFIMWQVSGTVATKSDINLLREDIREIGVELRGLRQDMTNHLAFHKRIRQSNQ